MKRSAQPESFCFFYFRRIRSRHWIRSLLIAAACLALVLLLTASPSFSAVRVYIGGTPTASIVAGRIYGFQPWAGPSTAKLKFLVSNKPTWASFDATTGKLSGPVRATEVGTYSNIDIGVTDGSTSAWLPKFSITVTASGATSPSVALSTSSYSATQTAGSVKVTVNRAGSSTGAVGVTYKTLNGTAVAGKDYTAMTGTLSWTAGDTSARTVSIPVSNATPFSGSKNFTVSLSTPTGSATLGNPSSATATITGSGTTSSSGTTTSFQVYSNGVFHWQGDYSWGVTINYKDTSGSPLTGPYDISVTGIGGFQPYATNYDFDPSAYKYLVVSLKPTIPNQKWDSAFYAVGDVLTGHGVNVLNYGPAPVVGQWTTYKIPLGAGGYQIPAGTHIYKFMFIDQTADVSGSGYTTNKWYVDNLYFTNDTSSTSTSTTTSTSGSTSSSGSSTSTSTSTTTVKTYDIYSNGVYKWQDDWSWGVVVNYKDTSGVPLTPSYDISIKGIGGYQPHAPNSDFDPSPYKYLTVALKPTVANQKWDSAFYATDGTVAGHGVNVLNYGPAPVVGQWSTYKIPLGAGGYEIPAGKHIFKFMFIDQTADQPNSGMSTNTWYVDNLGFTTDGSAVTSGSGSGSGSGTGSGSGGTTTTPSTGVTWMYLNGVKTLAGDFTGSGESTNYQHATSSGYNGGTKDILITSSVPYGYFIPYWASNYKLPNPGYTSLILSLKPSITGDTFGIHAERVGDQGLPSIELMKYGPAAVAGKWGSYVIPLKDLGVYGDSTLYKIVLATHTGSADSWELDAIGFK